MNMLILGWSEYRSIAIGSPCSSINRGVDRDPIESETLATSDATRGESFPPDQPCASVQINFDFCSNRVRQME